MKNIITIAAAAMVMVAAPAFAQQGPTASATAASAADIRAPITIQKTGDLNFGRLIQGYGANVTVSTAGTRSGDAGFALSGGATPTAATFSITGDNVAYIVTVAESATPTVPVGSTALTGLSAFTNDAATIAGNAAVLKVGATLPSGLAPGQYVGSFSVTVQYN